METRANYAIVGLFTLAAILAAFGFVYWTAGGGGGSDTVQLRVRIPGSASGLGRGSAVLFNGVKVGDVRRVFIDINNPSVAIADTEVDRLTPITPSTAADVGLAGLTGQANIELKGGDPEEKNILQQAQEEGRVAEITANPSAVTNLLQTAQSILTRADSVVTQLEGLVGDNRESISATFRNVEQFSAALGRNADSIDSFLENFGRLSETLGDVSTQLDSTLKAAEDVLTSVDKDQIASIASNIEGFTSDLRTAGGKLDGVITRVDSVVESVDGVVGSADVFSRQATETLAKVDRLLEGVDADKVGTALANFEGASKDVAAAAREVAKFSEKIGPRADDIDQIIVEAREMTERLNAASVRVDGVLQKVDSLLGSDDAEGLVAQANATVKAFREVAETMNARIGTISDGLARFSGQGLRDVEALVRQSRRSISRIEQAISDFERNPQRIITGGQGAVREYDGRARR